VYECGAKGRLEKQINCMSERVTIYREKEIEGKIGRETQGE
jgi:hypothetical protein